MDPENDVLKEGLTDDLRGVIVDEESAQKHMFRLVLGGLSLFIFLIMVWAFFHFYKSEDEIFAEKLKSKEFLNRMLMESSILIQNTNARKDELKRAVTQAITVASSPLRISGGTRGPYIPEREEAIVVALKGLLRLELEEGMSLNSLEDRQFLQLEMERLGLLTVEYYDRLQLKQVPLLKRAFLEDKLRKAKKVVGYVNKREVKELKGRIEQVKKDESFSIVTPAHLLGRWFRFHNKKEKAIECFEIGRRYVEGYFRRGTYIKGKRPAELGPLWHLYVECLEALAEDAFQQKKYREMRSYLTRMYNTPSSTTLQNSDRFSPDRTVLSEAQIEILKEDIDVYTRAINFPLEISTFPYFHQDDSVFNWNIFVETIQKAYLIQEGGVNPAKILVKQFGEEGKKQLRNYQGEIHPNLKPLIIKSLNSLIDDPNFYKKVEGGKELLSWKSQQILKKEGERTLSKDEVAFLNRDILDTFFSSSIDNPFILSDGTRIQNFLNEKQKDLLVSCFREEIEKGSLSSDEVFHLKQRIHKIYQGVYQPTLSDLSNSLVKKKERITSSLENLEQEELRLMQELQAIKGEIGYLEGARRLDIERLSSFQKKQSSLEKRQIELKRQKNLQEKLFQNTLAAIRDLSSPLKQSLDSLQTRLLNLRALPEGTQNQQAEGEKLHIDQVERQIVLKTQYLDLLRELQKNSGNKELEEIQKSRLVLDVQITHLKKKIEESVGDDKEFLLAKLDALEAREHQLVKRTNELFNPLRAIIEKISTEEKEVMAANDQLLKTRQEIFKLIGDKEMRGKLDEKMARRHSLLLLKPDDAVGAPLYDAELRQLSKQIASDHAQLQVLLETERTLKARLATFYPQNFNSEQNSTSLGGLQAYLKTQQELAERYEQLWKQNEVQEEIQKQEKKIVEHLNLISDSLDSSQDLSENQTLSLSRYMQNIVQARTRLNHLKRLLSTLDKIDISLQSEESISASRGFMMSSTDLYQMESSLGLKINEYQKAFEERAHVVNDLQKVTEERKKLKELQIAATRKRDQAAVDQLIPEIINKENYIAYLLEEKVRANQLLRKLAKGYQENYHKVIKYRKGIGAKTEELKNEINNLDQIMVKNDKELRELRESIFTTKVDFDQVVSALSLNDLKDVDLLIKEQENELEHLSRQLGMIQLEHYYKLKAMWLTALSCYNQSMTIKFLDLENSNRISGEMLEIEKMYGKEIFQEFTIEDFDNYLALQDVPIEDDQNAHIEVWRNYLERASLDIFNQEIPKNIRQKKDQIFHGYVSAKDIMADIESYIARSLFTSGEIHLKRAQRYFQTSSASTKDNPQGKEQLLSSSHSFSRFLDYVAQLSFKSSSLKPTFLQTHMGAQDFPLRSYQAINLAEEAKILLGVIAHLRGDYIGAIGHYREILTELGGDLKLNLGGDSELYIDPILFSDLQFSPEINPDYASMLAHSKVAHEVLYRIGRAYEVLALNEKGKLLNYKSYSMPVSSREDLTVEEIEERVGRYSSYAISYYSQLILTQAHSPYKKAAHLGRARLWKEAGHYSNARSDFIAVLGSSDDEGGSLDQRDLSARGDLPGELNPGYCYVAFEIGKLHFENNDFDAAAEFFSKAKETDQNNEFVVRAKIGFAKALIEQKKWVMANLFLKNLTEEKRLSPEERKLLYPPELYLDLALTEQKLGSMSSAAKTLQTLYQLAPQSLVEEEGYLDIENRYGMTLLQNDYRDLIRPLALASKLSGDLSLTMRSFSDAKKHYRVAESLFQKVPWKEDRILRDKSKDDYNDYKKVEVLAAKWGSLKADALEILYKNFADYRRKLKMNDELGQSDPEDEMVELIESMDQLFQQTEERRGEIVALFKKINTFYQAEIKKLPEVRERKRVLKLRERDRMLGGQAVLKYEALRQLREKALNCRKNRGKEFVKKLRKEFSVESLEDQIVNEFVMIYVEEIDAEKLDQERMGAGKSNLDNLLAISKEEGDLESFPKLFVSWIEKEMQGTGLDDLFIPLSPQSKVLEEVALYQVSLLAHLSDFESYQQVTQLGDQFIEAYLANPKRIHSTKTVWEMIEIVAMKAEELEDWKSVEAYNRYLLDLNHAPLFLNQDSNLLKQKSLSLATALINMGEKFFSDIIFTVDEKEKEIKQKIAEEKFGEARTILTELASGEVGEASAVTSRIRAKQLLEQIGA